METKICCICKKDLPKTTEFFARRYDRKTPQFQCQCRECQKEYRKKHYEDNKRKYIDKAAFYNKKTCEWFELMKSSLKCEKCGESRYWTLDFHHIDPKSKDGNISEMRHLGKKKILKEIKKCKVLCANCHRDLHYQIKIAL